MFRSRIAPLVAFALVGSGLAATAAAPAHALGAAQPNVVNAVPAAQTPDINNGTVYALGQVGTLMLAGGNFTSVSPHATPGTTLTRNNIVGFNATTGAIDTNFVPSVDGQVNAIAPGPTANQVFIGGSFRNVNGVAMRVALLNTTNGQLVSTWKPVALNAVVNDLVVADGQLFVAGNFTTAGGATRDGLVALDPSTGKLSGYATPNFTGHHNFGVNCDPNTSGCSNAGTGLKGLDVNPAGSRMVVIGNFTDASGNARDQVAVLNLGANAATVDTSWNTQAYTAACFAGAFDVYVRDVEFAPDGSYFVIVATGGSGTNRDGTNSSCDTAARYETNSSGDNVRPTWIDYTGQDTLWSVAVSGTAVYVGGHERWMNNSKGFDAPGPGAVPRPGIAALSPVSGTPLAWNPGRNPRGAGCYALLATPAGLWIGSDTDYIGNRTYLHKKIAFFPLAGGETLAPMDTPELPGRVYTAGAYANTSNSPVLYRVDAGGPTLPALDNGPDWQGDQNDPSPYRNSGSNSAGWGPGATADNTVPSTTPNAIFDSERWDPGSHQDGGEMHWAFPVPAGDKVDVRMYFANRCGCTSGVGQRVFDVAVNGQTVLDHFDMVAAVGDQKGTMRDVVVTSDGEVDIDLTHETENPLINGIEIVKQAAPTTFPATMYRVHSGGGELAAIDAGNPANWLADNSDTTGTGTAFRSGGNVAGWDQPWGGTRDASLPSYVPSDVFDSERWAPHSYSFPVAPGTPVNVQLFLANNCGCTNFPGGRIFNVAIDGNTVLSNYDIVADVGDRNGEMKSFNVTAPASGFVTVDLTNGPADNAVINGIQIDQTGPTPTPPPVDVDQFTYRHFDGTTPGAVQTMSTGIPWGSIRGAFTLNGELIYGKGDGNLYERTFDGTTFGSEVLIDPYDDPYWSNIATGSGQNYRGLRSDFSNELPGVTSMFFDNGRLFYTVRNDSAMHWRWFEPDSGIVSSDEFAVNDTNDWSTVGGAFLSGNTLYFADRLTGVLSKIGFDGTQPTGSPSVVDSTQNWASRGMFLLADVTVPNQKPTAKFTATCSSASTSCSFDASTSIDPDGSITDYAWTFGGGTTEHHPNSTVFPHDFGAAGTYPVTLTVTDNDGATDTLTKQVAVGTTTATPTFAGAVTACGPGTGKCGSASTTKVGVPATTAVGDALLMFVSWPNTTTPSASVPAGWQLLDSEVSGSLTSNVYSRSATAGDIGGNVTVTFSGNTRNAVTLVDYHGADGSAIEAYAKAGDSNTATHTTPNTTVTTDGSLAVSYWADKSSTTTTWTPPGSVTTRSTFFDTGTGYITSLLADSGSTVGSGTYGGKAATTNAASAKGAEWTIILAPATGTPPNTPPNARFTSNCTALACTFDASTSDDPDGSVASYAWDFGDGTTKPASATATASHTYAGNGTFPVTLTVTDNQNATGTVSHNVAVSSGTPQNIGFVGANAVDGTTSSRNVTVPAATASGDTMLMFVSLASPTITTTVPAGWTKIGSTTDQLSSAVYQKTATASDGGSSVQVAFSAAVKGTATIASYTHTASSPIEAILSDISKSTTAHTAPAVSGLTPGSWVISYWTDKSTTTSAWTLPAGVTKRVDAYGTGGGAVSLVLADSGAGVSGNYAAQTASSNATSGTAAQWTVALSPAS
jgi:PKD repeat protein